MTLWQRFTIWLTLRAHGMGPGTEMHFITPPVQPILDRLKSVGGVAYPNRDDSEGLRQEPRHPGNE